MTRDLRWMVAGTGALTFVIVGAIALVIRVSVLRRLQRFETTARLISQGDLERRVPAEGSDTLAWMAREFNAMADSVSGLVGEVRTQRERLETVINSIDDGIVVLDAERKIMAANDAFLQRASSSREQVLGCCCYELEPGPCNLSDCPTLACLRLGCAPGPDLRAQNRQRNGGLGRNPRFTDSGRLGAAGSSSGGLARHLRAASGRGEAGRVPPLGVGRSPGLRVFARDEHPSGNDPDVRGGNPPRDSLPGRAGKWIRPESVRMRPSRANRSCGAAVSPSTSCACRADSGMPEISWTWVRPSPPPRGSSIRRPAPTPSTSRCSRSATTLHVRADEAELQNLLVNLLLNAIQASKPGGKVVVATRRR